MFKSHKSYSDGGLCVPIGLVWDKGRDFKFERLLVWFNSEGLQ